MKQNNRIINRIQTKSWLVDCRWLVLFLFLWMPVILEVLYGWESQIVYRGTNDSLVYVADKEGNRIADFSYAGYMGGGVEIPEVEVKKTISPVDGDNTGHIETALFEIGLMPMDERGIRGALLLAAGVYEIHGTVTVGIDGVVLRGIGDGENPENNTILKAVGNTPHQRSVVVAGGGGSSRWRDSVAGSETDIISDTVQVGSRTFEVEDASSYQVGDNIIIYHPCTEGWLAAVDSGGTFWDWPGAEPGTDLPWQPGSQPVVFNRYITAIQDNRITIDAPVFNHLIRTLSQSYIYKYARNGLRTQIGIENLRIDIETAHLADEYHAWNALDLFQIEDAWVRNCTMLHFGLSGVRTNTATRITVENCRALDPVSRVTGGRRYNFQVYTASQQILFRNCHASNGRHHYVSNGTSWTSGCVFLHCTSSGAYAASEGHRRWSMGLLWDNLTELDGPRPGYNPRLLGLYNRGYYGTSHGWGSAHCIAWNTDVADGELHVQKPPTAQNYAIGCSGDLITGQKPPCSFPAADGYIEGSNRQGLMPVSLYEAQVQQRLQSQTLIIAAKTLTQPLNYVLHRNYPNPFNPVTTISYDLFHDDEVLLQIFNMKGERVRLLTHGRRHRGRHVVTWDGCDRNGHKVASGVYLAMLQVGEAQESIKMTLLR